MAEGPDRMSTHEEGRALVAKELESLGYAVAEAASDRRHVDLEAKGPDGRRHLIKVSAIRGPSWQSDIRKYIDVTLDGDRQVLGAPQPPPHPGVVYVHVAIDGSGRARFFPMSWDTLRASVIAQALAFLRKHDFVRPNKPDSFHTALWPEHVEWTEDDWSVLD